MRYLWGKIRAIKSWLLLVPAVVVLAWGAVKILGRVLCQKPGPGPLPTRYVTPTQEADARERIKDHRSAQRVETDRVADEAQQGLDDFLGGD